MKGLFFLACRGERRIYNMSNKMIPTKTLKNYTAKALKWYLGNLLFALFFPILLLVIVNTMSTDHIFTRKINELIADGAVSSVCCAIVGAVMVEFWVAKFLYTSMDVFLLFFTPFFMFGILALLYILMLLQVAPPQSFILQSWTSILVIIYSTFYCILAKANYYLREDERNETQRHRYNT